MDTTVLSLEAFQERQLGEGFRARAHEALDELLNRLDDVPATGAMVIVTWPKPKHGSGFPARVLAILP